MFFISNGSVKGHLVVGTSLSVSMLTHLTEHVVMMMMMTMMIMMMMMMLLLLLLFWLLLNLFTDPGYQPAIPM